MNILETNDPYGSSDQDDAWGAAGDFGEQVMWGAAAGGTLAALAFIWGRYEDEKTSESNPKKGGRQ